MSRIAGLKESELQTRVATLQTAVTEMKTSQYAGSANLLTQRYVSGNPYDFAASVTYQTTSAYEVTVNAADTTFAANPFIWKIFFNVVGTPATTGFLQQINSSLPSNGSVKYRLYLWGTDAPNLPETLNIFLTVYGLNIGSFSISRII